jgi:heme-degrading monooxygenase HmoA
MLTQVDGLLRWFRGKPADGERNEWVFVTVWRDKDAMRAFAGASAGMVLMGSERDLTESMVVELYELF